MMLKIYLIRRKFRQPLAVVKVFRLQEQGYQGKTEKQTPADNRIELVDRGGYKARALSD